MYDFCLFQVEVQPPDVIKPIITVYATSQNLFSSKDKEKHGTVILSLYTNSNHGLWIIDIFDNGEFKSKYHLSHFIVKLSRNIVHVCTVSYMVICRLVIVSNVQCSL